MKATKTALLIAVTFLALILLAENTFSGKSDSKAMKILKKSEKVSWTASSHMLTEQTITTTSGKKRKFKIEMWSKNGNEKQLLIYLYCPHLFCLFYQMRG